MSDLLVEGVNTRTADGFEVRDRPNLRGGPMHIHPVVEVVTGVVVVGRTRTGRKRLVVQGQIKGSSPVDVVTRLDRFKARARQSEEVALTFSDLPGREWFGQFVDVVPRPFPQEPAGLNTLRLAAMWDLIRPFAYSPVQTINGIAAADTAVPLGSEPTRDLVLRITGPANNPVVTMKSAVGVVLATLSLTVALAAGDWLDIDMGKTSIVDNNGANRADVRAVGSAWPLVPDPVTGTPYNNPPTWPTLACSSGTMRAMYRKAW